MRARLVLLACCFAGCVFDTGVPALDGVSNVRCRDSSQCPASADLCASLDPEDLESRRCVVRDTWPSADLSSLTVVAADGSPRTRFSRNPGFASGAILATVVGRPERLVATIETQVVPCRRDGASYRCDFEVTADTPEGQRLARVEVTDARGRVAADRVVVEFDFTAPSVIAGSVSTRITPPASSPLATLGPQWAPTALALGSALSVSFGVDEARVAEPRLLLGPLPGLASRSGAAFVGSLRVDASLPEGDWPLTARLVDDVGNQRDEVLGRWSRDDTPPDARLDQVLVERRPFAPADAGAGVFLSATGGLEPNAAVLASTRTSGFPVGVIRASPDGGLGRTQLSLSDSAEVLVTLIDAAGNASPPRRVTRYRLHATPGDGLIDNPTALERRFTWMQQLLLTNDFTAVPADVAAPFDGRSERISPRPTWRRQVLDTPPFECGAAAPDTAYGGMLVAGAWAGCATNEPQIFLLRGAGAVQTTEPINAAARFWPAYDSLRSRFVLLSAVAGLPNVTVADGTLSRFGSASGLAFSSAAYDPRRDFVVGLGTLGSLWNTTGGGTPVQVGQVDRLNAGLLWVPSLDGLIVYGGQAPDGGALLDDLVRLDGGVVARLPVGVQRPQVTWDHLEHTVRLVDRQRDATWLLVDGGFVAQPPTGALIDWWASWPGRGDALLNPGTPGQALWRGSQREPWDVARLPDGRLMPSVVARPTTDELLIVGGSNGTFPLPFGVSWRHQRSTLPLNSPTAFGGSALVPLSDGGLLMVGGATLDATNQPIANRAVWTWSEAAGWTAQWQGAPATFGTSAFLLEDGTLLVAASEQVSGQHRGGSWRLRLLADAGTQRVAVTGEVPTLLSTCATRNEAGEPLLIGGLLQTCDAGPCTAAPTRDVWRYTGVAWSKDGRLRLPSPRDGHACAYDAARRAYVAWGGRESGAPATTLRESFPDGGGWAARAESSPDGRPALREGATMAYDPSSRRLVLVGGRSLSTQQGLAELWVLEHATSQPGLTWRFSMRELGVPFTARWRQLTTRSLAGATGTGPDGGPLSGVELSQWVDGQWRPLATWAADAGAPTFGEATITDLDTSWFERHSVSVGVRGLGARGVGEADLTVDFVEFELEYELTE